MGKYLNNTSKFGPIIPKMNATRGLLCGKILFDILFDAPLYGSYIAMQQYHHKSTNEKKDVDYRQQFWSKFKTMYMTDLVFWIPANVLNFFYITPKGRVPFYATAVFVWAITLPIITKQEKN